MAPAEPRARATSIGRVTAARLIAPVLALAAAVLPTTVLVAATVPATADDVTDDSGTTPLSVHIDSLNRATLPRHGRLVVTGTVTNDSDEVWQDINVHPLTSAEPITSRSALATAAASDPSTFIGERLYTPHTFEQIGDLSPGDSAGFRLSLRADALDISGAPGVYWFGIHALGANTAGRDNYADGKARTFLPLLPKRHTPLTQTAVVVPLRVQVRRDPTGALLDTSTWNTDLSAGGLLDRELRFAESAQGRPLTWLVDPAVLQAVDDIAHGNPPLSYGEPADQQQEPSPSPTGSPSSSATAAPGSADPDSQAPVENQTAADWLSRLETAMSGQSVLGLPFADPDVAAVASRRPGLLNRARALADTTFREFGITDSPVVAPVDGVINKAGLRQIRPDDIVMLSDGGQDLHRSEWLTSNGHELVFTDARAESGGPAPTPPFDALALRQRIVAASALRALHHDRGPMVVVLPSGWDPGSTWRQARFFRGLGNLPWLQLSSVTPDGTVPTYPDRLPYPKSAVRHRIHERNMTVAHHLVTTGETTAQVLATNNDVSQRVSAAALAAVSYHARDAQRVARQQVSELNQTLHDTLAKISVAGTDFVTLSGGSGSLTVSLVNGLQIPVTVGVDARSDSPDVHIDTPKPVQVAAGQRTTVRLGASSSAVGVHQITLTPVSETGRHLGTPLVFSLRTSDVGRWIWVVLGGGGALLGFAIVRRLVRRVRGRTT